MRKIDADAFVEFLRDAVKQQKYDDLKIDEALTVADVIDAVISELEGTSLAGFTNAPTIEPERKKGKWERWFEKLEDASGVEYIPFCRCSECKTKFDPHSSKFINFCPNCGADMRGGQDG